jgi:Flp pilus assembly protein TadD
MVRQHPQDQGLVERLARLYTQQGRRGDAINLLDRLGEEQLNAGQTQKAINTIERILAMNPPNATSYEQLIADLRRGL